MIAFKRTRLAQELVAALRGEALLGDAHNGLFLAAPRRTGKSTFLQGDLGPALEAAGVLVVYVDLWADTRRDPGALIAEVIGEPGNPETVTAVHAEAAGLVLTRVSARSVRVGDDLMKIVGEHRSRTAKDGGALES